MYVYVYIYIYIYIYIYVCVCVCVYIYIYNLIHIFMYGLLFAGTGFQIPQYAANALNQAGAPTGAIVPGQVPGQVVNAASSPGLSGSAPPIATQCFMLSNMFDPNT